MTENILKMMLMDVDFEFFDNKLVKTIEKNGCCLSLCFNNKCTSLAGRCGYMGKQLKLEMMNNVFIKSFKNTEIKLRAVDNIPCKDILTCFYLTFCHEIVHGIVFCNCIDYDKTDKGPGSWKGVTRPGNGHSKTFMSILNNRFGHQKFTHNLNTGITVARLESPIFGSHNIKKGDIVILEVRKRDKTRVEREVVVLSASKVNLKAALLTNPNMIYKGRIYSFILRKVTYPKARTPSPKARTPSPSA